MLGMKALDFAAVGCQFHICTIVQII